MKVGKQPRAAHACRQHPSNSDAARGSDAFVVSAPALSQTANGSVSLRSNRIIHSASDIALALGTVKWFDRSRGYGFITPDNGANDIFVHMSALHRVGMTTLVEGQKVEYQAVIAERGGHQRAEKLKVA